MNKSLQSTICLFLAAIIWGSAFVAQRSGMDDIGPFYFCALRSLIGSLALMIVFLLTDRRATLHKTADPNDLAAKKALEEEHLLERKTLLRGGLICGSIIFIAMNTQQMGLVSTDAGKTGFITALYIVLVPIFGIFLKHKTGFTTWAGAVLGAVGLYFLCVKEGFSIQPSDLIILSGTLFWALHPVHRSLRTEGERHQAYRCSIFRRRHHQPGRRNIPGTDFLGCSDGKQHFCFIHRDHVYRRGLHTTGTGAETRQSDSCLHHYEY